MNHISKNQFQYYQPDIDIEHSTDDFYLNLANYILEEWNKTKLFTDIPLNARQNIVLGIIGYYQDIISDMGIWRSFISLCKKMYGSYVPFYEDDKNYIEYELNINDIKFLTWYFIAFNTMQYRFIYPLNENIQKLSQLFFDILNKTYDDAPTPIHFRQILDIDLYDAEYTNAIYDFSNWLFWHNYLIVPAFQLTYSQIYSNIEQINKSTDNEITKKSKIENLKREVMASLPTGPLALYLKEWIHIIIENKYPSKHYQNDNETPEHKYYTAFTKATGGKIIKFIETYEELNQFFISAMNWGTGEHLNFLKNDSHFVLFVNPQKGMIVAKNIAQCIKHPENPLYDHQYAQKNAFKLISERMLCPGDLLKYICSNNYLPDAKFPDSDNNRIVADNIDFISRIYLQEYYHGD